MPTFDHFQVAFFWRLTGFTVRKSGWKTWGFRGLQASPQDNWLARGFNSASHVAVLPSVCVQMALLIYLFYISKYLEFGDTVSRAAHSIAL